AIRMNVDRARASGDAQVPRELEEPRADRIRREDQVIKKRIRANRCRLRNGKREVWCESLPLRATDHRANGVARYPVIRVLQIGVAKARGRDQRLHVVTETLERVREHA